MRSAIFSWVLALCACDGTTDTSFKSGNGTIQITSPANNASVNATAAAPDVDVAFTVSNFTLRDPALKSCGTMPGCGHVHIVVDGTACNDKDAEGPYNATGFASPIGAGLDYCPTLSGTHVVTAELHNDDHSIYTATGGTAVVSNSITITVP
jgi:hypothetical protein